MGVRINRTIELLAADQPVYYTGAHAGHILTYDQGLADAATWADYINVGMEHGAFNLGGLEEYMHGLVDGKTASGHRSPTVIVEAPVEGTSEEIVRYNAWQFRQILGRGVHGIVLCQVESASAVRTFVESCRYPVNDIGIGEGLGVGKRGVGSEPVCAGIWGVDHDTYVATADPWPLNSQGELLLGLKIESVKALPHIEEILSVPGIGFAEMGPGDLSMSLGYPSMPHPWPEQMQETHERVKAACIQNRVAFLDVATKNNVRDKIHAGVRVIAGGVEEIAQIGRAYSGRTMPV